MKINESVFWDMDITAQKLIDSNDKCWLNTDVDPHKYDDAYTRVRIYVKHPNYSEDRKIKEHNDYIEIGIDGDGLTYEGDIWLGDKTGCNYVDIKDGIEALVKSIKEL